MSATLSGFFLLELQNAERDYIAVAGLRTQRLSLRAKPLARLAFDDTGWAHVQPASGAQSLQLVGSGLFIGATSDHLLRRLFAAGAHAEARIVMPDFGSFTGPFAITELAYEGQVEDLTSWRVALQSAGEIDFALA